MDKELRWSPFLVYVDNKHYAPGLRDDSLAHEDYTKGIHISVPKHVGLLLDKHFEYNGERMKVVHIQDCVHHDDHHYVFAKIRE